jgi:N-acyl-D-amino-acid deacylase
MTLDSVHQRSHRRLTRRQFLSVTSAAAIAAGASACTRWQSTYPAPAPPPRATEPGNPAIPDGDYDLVIANGTVIDGTGRERYRADVGVRNGRIAAISRGQRLQGRETIDAAGHIVAPGFIDAHSHSDWILPSPDHPTILQPFLLQGVTTVITGNCGSSPAPAGEAGPKGGGGSSGTLDTPLEQRWRSFGEFLDVMEQDGLLLNSAFMVGHGSVRNMVMGGKPDAPTADELQAMLAAVRDSLRQGAFGFTVGLAYAPGVFATNDELREFLKVTAAEKAMFAAHTRAQSWVSGLFQPMFFTTAHNVRATRELIDLSKETGVRFQNSHLIFVGRNTWRTYPTQLQDIEKAVSDGLDMAFDAYPYTAGDSVINVIFPAWFLANFQDKVNDPAQLSKLKREILIQKTAVGLDYGDLRLMRMNDPELTQYEGMNFRAIADRMKKDVFDTYVEFARRSGGKARIMLGTYSGDAKNEEPLRAVLKHPLCSFMTDAVRHQTGLTNPAAFGTFPRILGRYARDQKLFTLEEAVRRMTSYTADRFGLPDTGRIAEGRWADITIFNPETVADNATPENDNVTPAGIKAVVISGQVAARDGQKTSAPLSGRVLRRQV